MYTLAQILSQVRNLIGDTDSLPVYADEVLTDFINRAVEDISVHFPRRVQLSLATSLGEHEYAVAAGVLQPLSVEYPAGGDPPAYLARGECTGPGFWNAAGLYDWLPSGDADSSNPPRLVISAAPADGELIAVEALAIHSPLLDPGDETTIPEVHIHLVGLYVRWKCWQERASSESMDPDPLHLLSQTQELNALRAERQYRAALAAAVQAHNPSARAGWRMDKWDGGD